MAGPAQPPIRKPAASGGTNAHCTVPNTANAIAASLYRKLAYDPVKYFAPITQLAASPFILVVHPSVRASSVKELIALAKAEPGRINYASSGIGTPRCMSMKVGTYRP